MPDPLAAFRVVFVLGVTPTKWERIWSERMRRQRLELRPASSAEALVALRDGSADAAFVRDADALGIVPGEEFHVIPLYREAAVVVASRDHFVAALEAAEEVTLSDLDGENLLPGEDAATLDLVAAGVGVATMPQSVARALSRRDVVVRPLRDAPSTSISLIWRIDAANPAVETFIGIVRGRTARSSR